MKKNENPLDKGLLWNAVEKWLSIMSAVFILLPAWGHAQNPSIRVEGRVVSSSGSEPLIGANILVKGTNIGAVTDVTGAYTIAVPDAGDTLVFSYIGYVPREVPVRGESEINVDLTEDIQSLDEVIVVGYREVNRKDLTGSVAAVSSKEILQLPVVSTEQGLQGRIPGVNISQTSGAPGGTLRVRIRGNNSVQYGNGPLYVIDGFPINSSFNTGNIGASGVFGKNQGTSPLAFLNPNDIESISVLKDASATAIYGARGANGVVMITTKKGSRNRTQINFDTYAGFQQVTKKIDVLNARQWATLAREFWSNFRDGSLISRAYTEDQIAQMGAGTDWQDAIFRNAPIQNYNLSVSGGDEDTRFLVSGNFFDQQGIVIDSRYRRGALRLNLEQNVTDKLTVGTQFTSSFIHDDAIPQSTSGHDQSNPIFGAMHMVPVLPVRNPDGSYSSHDEIWQTTGVFMKPFHQNPVELAEKMDYLKTNSRTLANAFFTYKLLNSLTFKSSLGADVSNIRLKTFLPSDLVISRSTGGSASIGSRQVINWINENTLTYQQLFADRHSINVLIGYTLQQENGENSNANTQNFFSNATGYNDLSSGNNPLPPQSSAYRWSLMSYLGRFNYHFDSKYFVTVSARYDGSSRFGENNKFGFFPSAALAWRVSGEDFYPQNSFLGDLKIRASYGKTGNQDIPLYRSLETYTTGGQYVFGNSFVNSIVPGVLPNKDIKWEKTDQFDIGIDLTLFRDRVNVVADYYYKLTSDLLLNVPIPRQGGFTSSLINVGEVENKGMEFGLSGDVIDREFKWNVSANISFNRNKVLKLADADRFFGSSLSSYLIQRNGGSGSVIMEGQPIGVFWGNIFDGLWQTQEAFDAGHMSGNGNSGPGFENFRDIDGNGVFEEGLDETIVGNPHPDYEFGINNTLSYRNIDFSFFIYGKQGNDILNLNLVEGTTQINGFNGFAVYTQAWDGPGSGNLIPKIDRPAGRSGVFPNRVSTNFIEDGSFIRLRNVTLGYNFPAGKIYSLQRARVYVAAENLVTLTDYSGYDPEVNSLGDDNTVLGVDMNAYPMARTFRAGVQIGF